MAIWDFRPKGDLLTGLAVGAGVLAAPVVLQWAWSAVRPLLKVILKGGIMLYETGRGVIDEATTGGDEETPKKVIEATTEKALLIAPVEREEGQAPIGGTVKVSAGKQGKPKPAGETPRRQPKKRTKKPEKEE